MVEKFAAEGCNIAINYVSNLERAKQTANRIEKEYKAKNVIIQGVSDSFLVAITDLRKLNIPLNRRM